MGAPHVCRLTTRRLAALLLWSMPLFAVLWQVADMWGSAPFGGTYQGILRLGETALLPLWLSLGLAVTCFAAAHLSKALCLTISSRRVQKRLRKKAIGTTCFTPKVKRKALLSGGKRRGLARTAWQKGGICTRPACPLSVRIAICRIAAVGAVLLCFVLSCDITCGIYLQRAAKHTQSEGYIPLPTYRLLAAKAGAERRNLVGDTATILWTYNIAYRGYDVSQNALDFSEKRKSPASAPQWQEGAVGYAQYAPNGLLAEGYVFGADVALGIVRAYNQAQQALLRYLPAYNAAMGTSFSAPTAALADLRQQASNLRALYYANVATEAERTAYDNATQKERMGITQEEVAKILHALGAEMGDSTLIQTLLPLLTLAGDMDVSALLTSWLGEVGHTLAASLRLTDVTLRVEAMGGSVRLQGGVLGEGVALDLKQIDMADWQQVVQTLLGIENERTVQLVGALLGMLTAGACAGNPLYPSATAQCADLATAFADNLQAIYWHTPPDVRPIFDFYGEVAARIAESTDYTAFLQAAAIYDRAYYEGNVHGRAVGSCLIGARLGNGAHTSAAMENETQVATLQWRLRHTPTVLAVLSVRNTVAYAYVPLLAGVLLWCHSKKTKKCNCSKYPLFYRGFLCNRHGPYPSKRSRKLARRNGPHPSKRSRKKEMGNSPTRALRSRRCPVCAILLCILTALPLFVRGLIPTVERASYGMLDGAEVLFAPLTFSNRVTDEAQRYGLFCLLGGVCDEEYRYDNLTRSLPDGTFANAALQQAFYKRLEDKSSPAPSCKTQYDLNQLRTLQMVGLDRAPPTSADACAAPTDIAQNDTAHRLFHLLWQYYVLCDSRYAFALTTEAKAARRAYCAALVETILPEFRTLCTQGVAPLGTLFLQEGNVTINAQFNKTFNEAMREGYLPLAQSTALPMALSTRLTPAVALNLLLEGDNAVGVLDLVGAPIAVPVTDMASFANIVEDLPRTEQTSDAPLDPTLPHIKEAFSALCRGRGIRPVLYNDEDDTLYFALYPEGYCTAKVDYVGGNLIQYGNFAVILGMMASLSLPLSILLASIFLLRAVTGCLGKRKTLRKNRLRHKS